MHLARIAVSMLLVALAASPAAAQPAACTPLAQTTFVRDTLQELYLWYRDLPDADPARFDSPEAYLDAVRVRPVDRSFSYITSRAADEAFYSESQFIGLGLSTSLTADGLRVLQVFEGSPASLAGLERGARLTTIGGRSAPDLSADGALDDAFGPAVDGVEVTLAWVTRSGEARTASLRKRPVTIPTVSLTRVFEVGGRRVGYVFFRNFVRPSIAALDDAFAALAAAGIDELVLDLRYNGGGLVSVAQHLAGLIGGPALRDQVFTESRHNDRNRRLNETRRFPATGVALGLSRLVVITTRASASASELLVNGLEPFLPVVLVGDATFGKPVGQYGLPFCDKVLAPVAFSTVNARGEGDYFDGLPVDCVAADDLEHDLGSDSEVSLATALGVITTGTCPAPAAKAGTRRTDVRPAPRPFGWRQLLNAH